MKPKLYLFADYFCEFPIWDDYLSNTEYLDGTKEKLLHYGVTETTINLMKVLCYVYENNSSWLDDDANNHWSNIPWTQEEQTTYEYLITEIKKRLDSEIGYKFDIEIKW